MELGSLQALEESMTSVVAQLNPDAIPTQQVVRVFERFERIGRLASTATTLLARRVEESREWQRRGFPTPEEYLAAKIGSTVGAARDTLGTSKKVTELPLVEDAMRVGRLSEQQAHAIADAAATAPGAQKRLLTQAKRSSLKELRDTCRATKAAADPDPEATHRRIHEGRHVRTFTDNEGAWNLRARGTVDAGARIEAALRPLIDAEFENARAEDRHEPREAYAFDALVEGLDRSATPSSDTKPRIRHLGLLRIDLETLRRGDIEEGEYCEITGIGPIPVSVARELLGESILKLVITKGVDVLHVTHLGRGPSAAQKVALLWQNRGCIVEGCDRTHVEFDHRVDYRYTKHTRLDELEPMCDDHHDKKTYEGWALVEGTGKRKLVPPDHPDHPRNKPPP